MKKILITGASGNIASLARSAYRDHFLTLWSRTPISPRRNEIWERSAPLQDSDWWIGAELTEKYDVILHLAEPIKQKIEGDQFLQIVKSHVNFLKMASHSAQKVLYPGTAYNYDQYISNKNFQYRKIKNLTREKVSYLNNVYCPIIHPIIDYGPGLNAIRKKVFLVPIFNIFCTMDSTLPILERKDLLYFLQSFIDDSPIDNDWYSKQASISELFSNPDKINSPVLSNFLKYILNYSKPSSTINLIKNGRQLK